MADEYVPTPERPMAEYLAAVAKGRPVYRCNRVWGYYEFLQTDGTWTERATNDLTEEDLDAMAIFGVEYFDDSCAYGDEDEPAGPE